MRDPREGVAPDGTVVTGAAVARIPPAYDGVLADAVETATGVLEASLHSIHLYGSVATGQARVPSSDVDLLLVVHRDVAAEVAELAASLSSRHQALVREVAIGSVELATLTQEDRGGAATRCFLTHYAVCLAGRDLPVDTPPCRASLELAVGFNGDLGAVLGDLRTQLLAASDPKERDRIAARACRKVLLSAATLLSAREGGWSTDRATAVDLVARHAPDLAELARDAHASCDLPPPGGVADPLEVIDRLGGWLTAEYARAGA